MVSVPLPSQSPMSGTQPRAPKANGTMLGAPALSLLRRYQMAVAGSNAPGPVRLPPGDLAGGDPNWNAPRSGGFRRPAPSASTGSVLPTAAPRAGEVFVRW